MCKTYNRNRKTYFRLLYLTAVENRSVITHYRTLHVLKTEHEARTKIQAQSFFQCLLLPTNKKIAVWIRKTN